MGHAAAQHQGGESARHPRELVVPAPQSVNPPVERVDDPGRRAAHLHGLGQVPKSVEKAAHGDFGGDAAAPGAADSVGDRRHHLAARFGQFRADHCGGEILVLLARPSFRGKSDARPHAGVVLRHGNRSGSARRRRQTAAPPALVSGSRRQFASLHWS